MLKAGAGEPRPARPAASSGTPAPGPPPARTGALVGFAALLGVAALLVVALRGDEREPEPQRLQASTRASQAPRATSTPSDAKRAPRTGLTGPAPTRSAPTPPARFSAEVAPVGAPELQPEDVSDPSLKDVLAARDDPSPEATRTLLDNLTSQDEVVVAEATRALVARRATEAIGRLAAIELDEAAGSGLSVIDALGKLGGAAEGDERNAAVDRLLAMLREEKRRGARESPGNLLQIYEALGDTRDPRAAPALEAELLDANVPRAPKVVIVKALVEIGLASSEDALRAAHGDQSSQQGEGAFEEEIRQELVAELARALEAW